MATFSGKVIEPIVINQPDNADFISVNVAKNRHYFEQIALFEPHYTGVKTNNQPKVLPTQSHSGLVASNFNDNWFERIHITPQFTDVGFVSSPAIINLYVYNAYSEESKTFTALNSTNPTDAVLNGQAAPFTLAPLQELAYTVTVPVVGKPSFRTAHEWIFSGANDVASVFIGLRLKIFGFEPLLPYKEVMKGNTTISTSRNGSEERVIRSDAYRHRIEHDYHSSDNKERRNLLSVLSGLSQTVVGLPLWEQTIENETTISIGETVVDVDTRFMDLYSNGLIIFYNNYKEFEVGQIDSFTDTQVTLRRATSQAIKVGWLIMPIKIAYMKDISTGIYNTGNWMASVDFKVKDNKHIAGFSAPVSYLNIPVLTDDQYFEKLQKNSFRDSNEIVDYKGNDFEEYAFYKIVKENPSIRFELRSLEDKWNFRKLAGYLRGSANPVFIPSCTRDMVIARFSASTQNYIDIEDIGFTTLVDGRENKKYICITINNVNHFFTVVSSTVSNGIETVTLDRNIGFDLNPGDAKIQYMSLYRLDGDRIQWTHRSLNEASVSMRFIQINDEVE